MKRKRQRFTLPIILIGEMLVLVCICSVAGIVFLKPDLIASLLPAQNVPVTPLGTGNPRPPTATPPIATPVVVPTQPLTNSVGGVAPVAPTEIFSLDSANGVAPEDVLDEISYYGTGGGVFASKNEPFCYGEHSEPVITHEMNDGELMQLMEMKTCGWLAGETLHGVVSYPDGRVVQQEIVVNDCGCALLSHTADLSAPEGVYSFQLFSDTGKTLSTNTLLQKPVVPRLYELNDNLLMLFNFLPNEMVRLFMYAISPNVTCGDGGLCWQLQGWKEFKVNADGSLLIQSPLKDGYFAVIDSQGYEIATRTPEAAMGPMWNLNPDRNLAEQKEQELFRKSQAYLACPSGFPTKLVFPTEELVFYKNVKVVTPDGPALNVYVHPRTSARVIKTQSQGDEISIFFSADCFENYIWRSVTVKTESGDELAGYVIEGDLQGNYFLEEVPK